MVGLILMVLGVWLLMLSYLLYQAAVEISKIKGSIELAQTAIRIAEETLKVLSKE